jgi:hypothetical protein
MTSSVWYKPEEDLESARPNLVNKPGGTMKPDDDNGMIGYETTKAMGDVDCQVYCLSSMCYPAHHPSLGMQLLYKGQMYCKF